MASSKIEDRKSFLGGPWDVITGKNPVLKKGLFKPPMDPLVSKYDDDLEAFQTFTEKKKGLKALFQDMAKVISTQNDAVSKIDDELKKVMDSDGADAEKNRKLLADYFNDDDPDPKAVVAALSKISDALDDQATVTKGLNDKRSAAKTAAAAQFKKIAADYKSQSDAITSGINKLEDDLNKLDDQIRKLIQAYQQLANKMDKEDVADAVRSLLDKMP